MKPFIILVLFIVIDVTHCHGADRPIVGAIRWDAWTGGKVTEQVERTLGPAKYHNRLPWFAQVIDKNKVKINGSRQEVMDQEIEFAASAGLDYWAFLIYPSDNPMSTALGQYLNSTKRKNIKFCLILHNSLKVKDDQWPQERDRAVSLLKEPGYQTVSGDRQLVYAFIGNDFPFERFNDFLAAAKKDGLNPYCALMHWDPVGNYKLAKNKGFDAMSAYAKGSDIPGFAAYAKSVEKDYWKKAVDAKIPYIPLVSTGWDKHPRIDNPVSWEKKGSARYHKQKVFPSRATPEEIATHLRNALAHVQQYKGRCPAQAIIIYAWNEYDEGGWIAPTLGADGKPDTSRLDAIQKVLLNKE